MKNAYNRKIDEMKQQVEKWTRDDMEYFSDYNTESFYINEKIIEKVPRIPINFNT